MRNSMASLAPLIQHILRPRRADDEAIQRYHMGPQRMEAFVRRPDDEMVIEVYSALHGIMPFIPQTLGWERWPVRYDESFDGGIGGAFISIQREVEVPPFVACIVLKPKNPKPRNSW